MVDNPTISVCIMTLGRESLYRTLESLFLQKINFTYEIILILQGSIDTKRIAKMNERKIILKIFNYPKNLGFGTYRNLGLIHSQGQILAWIDDDEWTIDDKWLLNLTKPIIDDKYKVVTSGCFIPLKQGYFIDCISLLGYPGGGALGFDKVWLVNTDFTTQHLCGGNFAIQKIFLIQIGKFEEKCFHSCDDTHLAGKIIGQDVKIFYEPNATLYHVSRNISDLSAWIYSRRRGIADYSKISNNKNLLFDKVHHLYSIFLFSFLHPFYMPGMLFIIIFIIFSSFKLSLKTNEK